MKKILIKSIVLTCLSAGAAYAAAQEDADSVLSISSLKTPSEKSEDDCCSFDFHLMDGALRNTPTPLHNTVSTMTPIPFVERWYEDDLIPASETDQAFFSMLSTSSYESFQSVGQ